MNDWLHIDFLNPPRDPHLQRPSLGLSFGFSVVNIYIYSFSRHLYPKRLTIEEYNKQYTIKRQTDIGRACNTNF